MLHSYIHCATIHPAPQSEEMTESTGMSLRRYHLLRTGAALKIQQWTRAWQIILHRDAALLAKQHKMATRLQARWRAVEGRSEAARLKIRKFEAARKIQNMYRNWKRYKIWQRTFRQMKIEEQEGISSMKRRLMLEKKEKFAQMISDRGKNIAAAKIQRQYFKYIAKVHELKDMRQLEEDKISKRASADERQKMRDARKKADKTWGASMKKAFGPTRDERTVLCTVLYTVLYYTVLYCTVLYCTLEDHGVVHCTIHCTMHCTMHCTHVLYSCIVLMYCTRALYSYRW
jgi:hypothetical protein